MRPSDWSLGLSVQQQIFPRASVEVGYYRRTFTGFSVTDNLLTTARQATTPSASTAPPIRVCPAAVDSNLELYNLKPEVLRPDEQLHHGLEELRRSPVRWFNGVDVNFNVRMNGITFSGGTSTGNTVEDRCDIRAEVPEMTIGFSSGTESVLSHRIALADAVPRPCDLHDSSSRRAGQHRLPGQTRIARYRCVAGG